MLGRPSWWELEQRLQRWLVQLEREQRPFEHEQQHWVSLRLPLFIA